MSKTTFEDYKIAIWREFEIIKKNDITGFFSDLSPAMVRDYYVHLIDKGLSKADEEIMKSFFETKENESLKKSVNNSNTDKFKPVISFLTGKTKNPDKKIRVELAAILISFEQRPHHIFSKIEPVKDENNFDIKPKIEIKVDNTVEGLLTNSDNIPQKPPAKHLLNQEKIANPKFSLKKATIGFGILTIIFSTAIYLYVHLNHKDCLEWKNDRYIEVDCNAGSNGFINTNTKIGFDENLLKIRKINPTDTTSYFKNGKATIWYCKDNDGNIELFNTPGYHPVTNKTLKPITEYIINKYNL